MNTVGVVAAWLFSLHRPLLNGDFAILYLLVPHCRRGLVIALALALVAIEWYVLFCLEFYYFNVWSLASLGVSEGAPLLLALLAAGCVVLYAGAAAWIASSRILRKRSVALALAGLVLFATVLERGMNAFAAPGTAPVDLVRFPVWSLLRTVATDAVERKLHLERIGFSQEASFEPLAEPSSAYAELKALADGGRDTILVVVEALGFEPGDEWRQFLVDAVTRGDSSRRLRFGSDAAFGFTVHGEFRILCNAVMSGLQVNHARLPPDCIPRVYQSKGLMTRSFHGYSGAFYRRTAWYPQLGFKEARWADSVQGAPCRFVFVHACDEDLIEHFLGIEPPARPGFDYLLTLDAHLPFLPAVHDYVAAIDGNRAASPYQVYRALTRNTLGKVGEIIRRRPTATVVITGDHAPYMLLGRRGAENLARDRVSVLVVYPEGR